MISKSVYAIVLAGGDDDKLAKTQAVTRKADIIVNSKPLYWPVLNSLIESDFIKQIFYVGNLEQHYSDLVTLVNPGDSFVDSLKAGFEAAIDCGAKTILVITADLPFVRKKTIDSFISNCPEADLVYPIISQEVSEKQFPKQKRTYVKLIEGRFTGGNGVLLKASIIPKLLPFADKAYKSRKSPLKLATLIGLVAVIKLLIGRASISTLESKVSFLLGAKVVTLNCSDASLGTDLDRLEHLQSLN